MNGIGRTREGSALLVVLWVMVVLGVVGVSALHTTQLDLRITKNYGDRVQARYLALAGIEKAKALLHEEIQSAQKDGRTPTTRLHDAPLEFRDIELGRGFFRVCRERSASEGGGLVYGVRDEGSRLNVNAAPVTELAKLPGLGEELAGAIADWRDGDSEASPGGAEAEYYAALDPPLRIRNGPIETLRELLLVRGVDPDALLGEDANANGLLDPNEDDGSDTPPRDNRDGRLQTGWGDFLAIDNHSPETDLLGRERLDLNSAGAGALVGVSGVSQPIAEAIVAWRASNSFGSLADLLNVTEAPPAAAPGGDPANAAAPPEGGAQAGGSTSPGASNVAPMDLAALDAAPVEVEIAPTAQVPPAEQTPSTATAPPGQAPTPPPEAQKVIGPDLLPQIADRLTATAAEMSYGLVNINLAPREVLAALGGLDASLAENIIAWRDERGGFKNVAELLSVSGITSENFAKLCPRVCVRSSTYRILAEGVLPSTHASQRIEVVVSATGGGFETLSYREDP